jgi:hypothetical protein
MTLHRKIWMFPVILILILVAFMNVDIPIALSSLPTNLIKGVVVEKDSSIGLSAVKVKLFSSKGQYATVTGAGGTFKLEVPTGSYDVEVTHPAYQDLSIAFKINSGQIQEVRWSLQRKANLDLGWYSTTGPESRDQYKTFSEDVNTVILYTSDWECGNDDIQEALKAMPDRIGVWLSLPYFFHIEAYHDCRTKGTFALTPNSHCGFTFEKSPTDDSPEYCATTYLAPLAKTLDRIEKFEGANKIRGWYLFDEPYYSYPPYRDMGWNANIIKEVTDFVRKNDPSGRPVIGVINDGYDDDPKLGSLQDWAAIPEYLGYDYYPKWKKTKPCENVEPFTPLDAYEKTRDNINTLVKNKGGASSYYVAQGQGCKWDFGRATPTLQEIRWHAWTGILRGIGGIVYWWYPKSDEDIGRDGNSIRTSVHQVFREIRQIDIGSILYLGEASQAYSHNAGTGTLDIAYRRYKDHWYLTVVNGPDQDRDVTFTLNVGQSPLSNIVTDLIENRQIKLEGSGPVSLTDYLPKGAVRVYRLFDPTNKLGENLLQAGSDDWQTYGFKDQEAAARMDGSYSAYIDRAKATGKFFGVYQDHIPIKPDTEYRLSLRIKTEEVNRGYAAAAMGVWSDDPSRNHHSDFGYTSGTNGWVPKMKTWQSGFDETAMTVVLFGGPDFTGKAYFDHLFLEEVYPKNPGFERGLHYWESYGDGSTYEAVAGGVEGSHSAKIFREDATGRYFGLAQRNIPCEPNTTYQLTLWVKTEALRGQIGVGLGNWGTPNTHADFGYTGGNTNWKKISGTWTSRTDETSLSILLFGSTDFSGTAYFDDIVLQKVGSSAPSK